MPRSSRLPLGRVITRARRALFAPKSVNLCGSTDLSILKSRKAYLVDLPSSTMIAFGPALPAIRSKSNIYSIFPIRRFLKIAHNSARYRPSLSPVIPILQKPFCSVSAYPTHTMKQNRLGNSDIMVSEVCLGTMTWGVQNTEEEAHEQLDYAISRGVNFIDTAEIYPVPSSAPTWKPGRSEEIIGRYIAKHPDIRSKLVLATKISGFNPSSETVAYRHPDRSYEGGSLPPARHDAKSIEEACEASLRRLQTDYIDLYQLHWPDRYVPLFGNREYRQENEREAVPFKETLLALKKLLDAGKIRAYGLSNETTFGVCQFVQAADEIGMPRPVSIQNSFCLLNRAFEWELAEACAPSNYNIGLLPWSILAGGSLTGKYIGKLDSNKDPLDDSLNKARFVMFKGFMGRFCTDEVLTATARYQKIAKDAGMSVATLAQAFCKTRWYIPSSIIGATTIEQLKENIDAFEVELSADVLEEIDRVHNANKDMTLAV